MKIITDHKWKPFTYRCDVPESILGDQFDWTNEEEHTDGFFKYRKWWYHLGDFMRVDPVIQNEMKEWHGIAHDSYFSGVLIKLSDDGEEYMIATVFS